MGMEAVEFRGGPFDGLNQRFKASHFRPGLRLYLAGAEYELERKTRGCAWQAVHVSKDVSGGQGWQ